MKWYREVACSILAQGNRDYMQIDTEKEIENIKKRNMKVEADKAWETSNTRRAIISAMTYLTVGLFLFYIKTPDPFIIALVPTIGYLLSTFTMPVLKKIWLDKIYKRRSR